MSRFAVDIDQNAFLPVGGVEANAIVTVTSKGAANAPSSRDAAEIIMVDASGSMGVPETRIRSAQEATRVAIGAIRDGVKFAVIAGNHKAYLLYPPEGGLVAASNTTRPEAQRQVRRLRPGGGTAMGAWLTMARELFATVPDHICHAILLTDGENEHESPKQLDAVLAACEGRFQCDCRGVGTDWKVDELRRIKDELLGSVDIIPNPADMPAAFSEMMEAAMGKSTSAVSLRVWTPRDAEVKFVRQVHPDIVELTDRAARVDERTADYPTGSWGEESRDYHICVRLPPHAVGDEMLAARVRLVEGTDALSEGKILAKWTDDEQLSTRINRKVADYTGQAQLADCIQDGLKARSAGDVVTATDKLGQAVALAAASGNEASLKLLEAVVEVDDAATGTVRLRSNVKDADEMALDTRSTRTVRLGGQT